jgi:hypothetical protein
MPIRCNQLVAMTLEQGMHMVPLRYVHLDGQHLLVLHHKICGRFADLSTSSKFS